MSDGTINLAIRTGIYSFSFPKCPICNCFPKSDLFTVICECENAKAELPISYIKRCKEQKEGVIKTKKIWKYDLRDDNETMMPEGAEILSVHSQGGCNYVWALVETNNRLVGRRFRAYATGGVCDSPSSAYIGTTHMYNGTVWHIFEDI